MTYGKLSLPFVGAALCLSLTIMVSSASALNIIVGTSFEIHGPDDMNLDPAMAIIAVNVNGDTDRLVNGVMFRTDGQGGVSGTATEGGVSVTTSTPNQINDWAAAPTFTSGSAADNAELAEVMRDIRWADGAAGQVLDISITGLTPGAAVELQLLTNEGQIRDRRWDISVDGVLVVDDYSSVGGDGAWDTTNSYVYQGEFVVNGAGTMDIQFAADLGGDPNLGADINPILQGIVLHNLIPEPSTFVLAALGLLTLAGAFRRRRRGQ
ncbi:MAG: PEP-CTERM sorting domain-containing protein [Planctomycetes bacterium]|nr:PEP-CTERM sorting domain-containing protein [Planctomycetota bacterium]